MSKNPGLTLRILQCMKSVGLTLLRAAGYEKVGYYLWDHHHWKGPADKNTVISGPYNTGEEAMGTVGIRLAHSMITGPSAWTRFCLKPPTGAVPSTNKAPDVP